ncbi:UDP-N-acetylmuramoyl-tripeptide--D-alanyl-D-alanine ligase [Oleiphilus sp. HI0066]|uniref:UDP-N-acetylmuramoyl-tripeptide--D-alanyl-D- alanine ligase n=2 Tax=unclassified Oleiphilus TaxID=2631174 RepID=UPI0007C3A716|nr:UDP-N-acetylmuramoyl-tripeptide--D-alanyl-D-alanine ligase [Oleiphilus sp. HI0066]KZY65800.1 hypothetical protein A3738_07940 [Oleiphilus sp. HI0066]KZY70516.1 hypothetical protein A3739_06720 [Oleiphilus sp. HI0067]
MIASMALSTLGDMTRGALIGNDVEFTGVSTDSRTIKDGDLYLALRGEQFDGHGFVDQVSDRAVAIVVEEKQSVSLPQLIVGDSREALGFIGRYCRDQFDAPVIAITGSSGKTTTRKMLSAIMAMVGEVGATKANENNEIGVPKTLMSLQQEQCSAVIELGARHIGDIAYLGRFVHPDVSILLNAGSAHIGEFGGYENIVKGKGEIYDVLSDEGVAVVNIDDKAHKTWLKKLDGKRVLTYSIESDSADVYAKNISLHASAAVFDLCFEDDCVRVSLNAGGVHNVSNALACAAAAIALRVSMEDIAQGLANFKPEGGRQALIKLNENLSVIDDCYNANPSSMKAALDVLAAHGGNRIAVLGEMGELGSLAGEMHRELAQYASELPVDEVWLLGNFALEMASELGEKAKVFESKSEIAEALAQLSDLPATVLLKASRFVALEEVIELFRRGQA